MNLIRVSKINTSPETQMPFKKATFYKWRTLKKHPEIFVKFGGGTFVDKEKVDALLEAGPL